MKTVDKSSKVKLSKGNIAQQKKVFTEDIERKWAKVKHLINKLYFIQHERFD